MKKFISILLAVLFTVTALSACSETTEETSQESSAGNTESNISADLSSGQSASDESSSEVSSDPYTDSTGRYVNSNDVIDWGGKEFSIIVRGAAAETYQSDDFTTGSALYGELLDTAVTERNNIIEAKYNVKLKIYKSDASGGDTIISDIRNDVSGGTQLYDAIMPTIPALAVLAQEGSLCDLSSLEYIHLDAPWWDKNATSTFSIANKCYFTTGDITILNKVCSGGMLFNKDMIKTLGLESPYDLVNSHEWTYDKMKEMAKAATKDTDGVDGMSCDDTWGLLASYNDALGFYGAAGQKLCDKDADDYPYLSFGSETSVSIIQQIINDMIEENTWVVYAQNFENPIWVTSLNAFIEGRILFRPSAFSATTKLRIAGADFGIVPMPLWSTDQEEYCTYCGTGETAGIGISTGCADPEYSAYMIEAIACESKNYITPAYVEINLKSKDMQDNESLEMLDIIFNNLVYDTGDVYAFGGINGIFTSLVQTKNNNIISAFDSKKDSIEVAIDDLIASYLANGN